jgi:thiol-disulfide isomerase/thioredoxin
MISENKYVLAYFFHPACIPCMEFSETFNELPKALEDLEWAQDIELVQINMGADTEKIKEMYNIDGKNKNLEMIILIVDFRIPVDQFLQRRASFSIPRPSPHSQTG